MPQFRILSVDGGGIRGIIPAIWLKRIEEEVGKDLYGCFDLVCGTSTGAVVAAAVALGQRIDDSLELYEVFGPDIFPAKLSNPDLFALFARYLNGPIYDDGPLQDALTKTFGVGTLLSSTKTKLLLTSYDVFSRSMFLMRSYDEHFEELKVWEACKASCSAPTYFPAHIMEKDTAQFPLIDGGVFANNPALLGVAEAVKLHGKDSMAALEDELKITVISLGTGNVLRKIDHNDALNWGPIQWVRPLLEVLMDGSSELTNHCARQIVSDDHYIRLQFELDGDAFGLDDARPESLRKLRAIAQNYIDRTTAIDRIKKLLL